VSIDVPAKAEENIAHLERCNDDGCLVCTHLLEFFMACDHCGHWGHVDSDGWFRGADDGQGGASVYCSEKCRAEAEPL
jgi:hypothetical protein